MYNTNLENNLHEYIFTHKVFNTHTHQLPDSFFDNYHLIKIFEQGYVNWLKYPLADNHMTKDKFIEKVKYKSYFVWLEKALKSIYGFDFSINASNWSKIDDMINSSYSKNHKNLDILKNDCRYEQIILDAYWQPGSNNDHSDIFKSTFRIDPLLQGYNIESLDHDGNNPFTLYGKEFTSLDQYVEWVKELIKQQKQNGCVALKSAVAYDRGLDFHNTNKNSASKVFLTLPNKITITMIKDFQDYVFQIICELACEYDLPLQCHTGMGILDNTRAMAMHKIIERNPKTKFVLFHCSFPWTDDICALLHNYANVYPDLCWLPLLSFTSSKKVLHQLIEIGSIDKISWGCDTRTPEESFGALLAFQNVLFEVLCEKYKNGYLSIENTYDIVDHFMLNNALTLYINK
ncbi:MAG: TatD family hydrolase [Erysipelotrichaceae bacterium]|nr:TatD family hydrolase [Erysipelotrichaceae bacterium]